MYSKGKAYMTFFKSEKENTDKTVFGVVSEAIEVGVVNGKKQYEYDNWNARFVGKAFEKAKFLEDKARIIMFEWNTRNTYIKNKNYPQITIFDFDLADDFKQANAEDIPFTKN